MANYYEITLALAGVCQAAKMVEQFAMRGYVDESALRISLESLLQTTPPDILSIYGGHERNLKLGLETLIAQLNGEEPDVGRYWLSLLALEGRLNKNTQAKAELARRIQYLPSQLAHYELLDDHMFNILASIYVDVVSPLGSRIQVQGTPLYLQQEAIHHKIRACLLAGMRSAVLWKQVGGSKWQILFSRRKLLNMAQQIYSSL